MKKDKRLDKLGGITRIPIQIAVYKLFSSLNERAVDKDLTLTVQFFHLHVLAVRPTNSSHTSHVRRPLCAYYLEYTLAAPARAEEGMEHFDIAVCHE